MARAICLKCGELKRGAFNGCPTCHSSPRTEDERITSMMLTEYYLDEQTMMGYQDRIRKGAVVVVDENNKGMLRPVIKELGLVLDSDRLFRLSYKGNSIPLVSGLLNSLEIMLRLLLNILKNMKNAFIRPA